MININKKIIISWTLVLLWAIVIFIMSNMDNNESNNKSKATINIVIEKSVETTNQLDIIEDGSSEKRKEELINKFNQPLRKVAHASEYLIFTILLFIALTNSGVTGKKIFLIAILICSLYACADEYHQTFVNGRTGQIVDILIDILGGIIGCLLIGLKNILLKIRKFKKYNVNCKANLFEAKDKVYTRDLYNKDC